MLRVLPAGMCLFVIVACATLSQLPVESRNYRFEFVAIEGPEPSSSAPAVQGYNDDALRLASNARASGFNIIVTNHSNVPLRVLWDEASYVDIFGEASGVSSGKTRFADVGRSQVATVVPSGASATLMAIPNSNISGTDLQAFFYGPELDSSMNGMLSRLLLPIEIGNARRNYTLIYRLLVE